MFDPVTNDAIRLRRRSLPSLPPETSDHLTTLFCRVCKREISPEEDFIWVGTEPHCFQCHEMLAFELEKEREMDEKHRRGETRWEKNG